MLASSPALLALFGSGCGDVEGSPCGPVAATVIRVIDGDTIELEDGQTVRYLLVDTPEITGGKDECFGEEAREFNAQLVMGQRVALSYDQECTDRYGRLLSFVRINDREINTLMVQRGYGCSLYIAPSGESRRQEFEDLEFEARSLQRGLWNPATCEENPCAN